MKMRTILLTGAEGFMGKNLAVALRREKRFEVLAVGRHHTVAELAEFVASADFVFHLAGVNRPKDEVEFTSGNADLTRQLCELLLAQGRKIPIVFPSSIQAELDNPYGRSKKAAEDWLVKYSQSGGGPVYIYRLSNVFGKWSRPNYNTVVATFCHNISRGLEVKMTDRSRELNFIYIDDIVRQFVGLASRSAHDLTITHHEISPVHSITLGKLYDLILSFHASRHHSWIPNLSDPLSKYLYSTYLFFCDSAELAQPVELKTDERGWLFELVKSPHAGQIFVSQTKPGITRGNHYHDTKVEKFCVIQGEGVIRLRGVLSTEIIEYPVSGQQIRIVDIPPGYTHSIENNGTSDMITLFWANEVFDPQHPDTHFVKVEP